MKTTNALIRVMGLATVAVSTVVTAETILGTAGADYLIGTPSADTINGRGGADTMIGLAGNDTYVVDDEADQIVEQAGGGTDRVRVFGWYALPANVENLTVAGSGDGGGKGNLRANRMIGNSASNTFDGGPGNDTLTGHGGPDDFVFSTPPNANTNVDRVLDFNVAEDSIVLSEFSFPFIWFACLPTGPLPPYFFHVGAANSSQISYNPVSGALYSAVSGTYVRFATLSPNLALKAANFHVVRRRACP